MNPLPLNDNRVPVYYAGGERISAFRGESLMDGPEDWVGSVSALPAAILPGGFPVDTGVSHTPQGPLPGLISADPQAWLGPRLAMVFGGQTGLLVKLLDAGQRLPVHAHPGRDFARAHLNSLFGKTEGWIVLAAEPGARVWLGLRDPVDRTEWRRWVQGQDTAAMLAAMNELTVVPGQVIYVPAGLPHAIGAGVMVTELQEPTSFSVLAEYDAFGVGPAAATLGLGWDLALSCFDLSGYASRLAELMPAPRKLGPGVRTLFPAHADVFFRALLVESVDTVTLPEPSFAVLVVTDGAGELSWDHGSMPIARGQTLVVPMAAGRLRFDGNVSVLVCLPPEV